MLTTVLRHRFRRLVREDWTQWVQKLSLALMGAYFAVGAALAGALFPLFIGELQPGTDPAALLNAHLLPGLLGLVAVRFFVQPSPHTDVRPYLHLPVDRARLARVVLGLSAVSLINGLALCFLVPVWISTVLPAAPSLGGALAWGLGAGALLLATHYLMLPLRILSGRYGARFWSGAALTVALVALDTTVGPGLVAHASTWLFATLAQGGAGWLALVLPLAALGGVFAASAGLLLHAVRSETGRTSRRWWGGGRLSRLMHAGPGGALAALELKLVQRNSRALIPAVMGLLAVPYVIVTVSDPDDLGFFGGLFGLFSSGGVALFYGQNIFSWSGAHLDGLLARAPSLGSLVRGRLRLLQGSCLMLYLLGLPLFAWFMPQFVLTHTAFLFFNAGVICPLVVLMALFATKSIDLSESAFSNQGGSNWVQLPFTLLIFGLGLAVGLAPAPWSLWFAGGLGLAGLAASPLWVRALTRVLAWRRYRMLAGFRSS